MSQLEFLLEKVKPLIKQAGGDLNIMLPLFEEYFKLTIKNGNI